MGRWDKRGKWKKNALESGRWIYIGGFWVRVCRKVFYQSNLFKVPARFVFLIFCTLVLMGIFSLPDIPINSAMPLHSFYVWLRQRSQVKHPSRIIPLTCRLYQSGYLNFLSGLTIHLPTALSRIPVIVISCTTRLNNLISLTWPWCSAERCRRFTLNVHP